MTKVKNLENKIPDGTTVIHINKYNIDQQNLEKSLEMLTKISRYKWFGD